MLNKILWRDIFSIKGLYKKVIKLDAQVKEAEERIAKKQEE